MRSDRDRLLDILEAIEKIEQRLPASYAEFSAQEVEQVWALHHLQIIGEAARGLSARTLEAMQEIPWADVVGMRNVVVHQYFGVDLDEVWKTLLTDVARLRNAASAYLQGIEG